MGSVWKGAIKPGLRWIRDKAIGDDWRESIRPIAWWNSPIWIWETAAEDRRFYPLRQRPHSVSRLQHLISPNLSKPIFIFGSPRSGTTFLGECLSVLPEVSYHFEPVLTKAAVRYIYEKQWSTVKAKRFYHSVYGWLMRIHNDGDLCFCEKTPRNSFILPFLYEAFPDGRFIHIIRDGRDASISLSQRPWYRNDMRGSGAKEPGGYPFGPKARFWVEPERTAEFETTNDLHRCIWLWRRYLEATAQGSTHLPAQQYYELRYENLVATPEREAQRLLDFLEVEVQTSRTTFVETIQSQIRQDSVGNWKTILSAPVLDQMYVEAGQWLNELGYTRA
ncbi:MAG: sulfotransferase [Cyanobacteria bacterium J06555_13]